MRFFLVILPIICACTIVKPRIIHKELPYAVACSSTASTNKQTNILVLYNNSGNGHISASKAISESIGNKHCLSFVDFSRDIVSEAWDISSPDTYYNKLLKQKNFSRLNFMAINTMPTLLKLAAWRIKNKFNEEIKRTKPNLIISTIPYMNFIIIDAAKEHNIPVIVLTLDIGLDHWVTGINKTILNKANYSFTVGLSPETTIKQLTSVDISKDNIYRTGFPLRKNFLHPVNKESLKSSLNIEGDAMVIMTMLGGSASDFMIDITNQLNLLHDKKYHLIFVAGNNSDLKKRLEQFNFNKNIKASIFGFTENVASLMAVSDLLIGKPGSLSVYEAIHMKLPMILDLTSGAMIHESVMANFVKENNIGLHLKDINNLSKRISSISTSDLLKLKSNINKIDTENFSKNFPILVNKILNKTSHK